MTEFVKYPSSPIAADGWIIVAIGTMLTIALGIPSAILDNAEYPTLKPVMAALAAVALLFVIFSLWFFRDPSRMPAESGPQVVVSAADGTVLKVESVNDPRYGAPSEKISIFMSPLNVHVNRAPIQGTVEKVEYVKGKFFAANLDKASTDNERNLVIIRRDDGVRIGFLQIAGFIARRIVCHVKAGDRLEIAQRYGMIRFGSRMEMFLPAGSKVSVKPGDVLAAGQTVVAKLP